MATAQSSIGATNLDSTTTHETPGPPLVFIVGVNKDWPAGRDTIGDIAIYKIFLQLNCNSVSPCKDHVVFIKDDDATCHNICFHLRKLLRKQPSQQDMPLVIYYAGHGEPTCFCTMGEGRKWTHYDVITTVETYFKGDYVWIILDCCYSGNFYKAIEAYYETQKLQEIDSSTCNKQHCNKKKSYACIMSTRINMEASGEWTLTECWIKAMQNRLIQRDQEALSPTSKQNDGVITIRDVVGAMSDEVVRVKREVLTFYSCGNSPRMQMNSPFPFITPVGAGDIKTPLRVIKKPMIQFLNTMQHCVSSKCRKARRCRPDFRVQPPTARNCFSWNDGPSVEVGDKIYAKWHGGKPLPYSVELMPLWYPAIVLEADASQFNIQNQTRKFLVELNDPITQQKWQMSTDARHILNEECFGRNDVSSCQEAHCALAAKLQYIDYSIPSGSRVWGMWDDHDCLYTGTVMKNEDVPWEGCKKSIQRDYPNFVGPFVPVYWDDDATSSIIPRAHCAVMAKMLNNEKGAPNNGEKYVIAPPTPPTVEKMRAHAKFEVLDAISALDNPLQAMMVSFNSTGKCLCPAEFIAGTRLLQCFWIKDGQWYLAKSAQFSDVGDDLESVSILSGHLEYHACGNYCLVEWEVDGKFSILPSKFIRRRDVGTG